MEGEGEGEVRAGCEGAVRGEGKKNGGGRGGRRGEERRGAGKERERREGGQGPEDLWRVAALPVSSAQPNLREEMSKWAKRASASKA